MDAQVNSFNKGTIQDIDNGSSPSDYAFFSRNARFTTEDGKNVIVVNDKGNEWTFSINSITGSDNYPIATVFFKGILFILSYDSAAGHCEFGSYPSLDYVYDLAGGTPGKVTSSETNVFELNYKPFPNKINSSSVEYILRGVMYWDMSSHIQMFAKPSFDGSIDLYVCDDKNPNSVINCGFSLETLIISDRKYFNLTTFLNIVLGQYSTPIFAFNEIPVEGILKPGNYWLHIRYLNDKLESTAFLQDVGPLSLSLDLSSDKRGLYDATDVINCNKAIKVDLSNIDQSYSFFEIAVVRYFGSVTIGASYEMYLIDIKYPINFTTTYSNLLITGREPQSVLTVEDLLEYQDRFCISRSHTQVNKRYFGANWKALHKNNYFLANFARRIWAKYSFNTMVLYDDEDNILNKRSFCRGECYPFSIEFEFTDGSFSLPFPIRGCDDYDLTSLKQDPNDSGVYRFPMYTSANENINKTDYILTIDFFFDWLYSDGTVKVRGNNYADDTAYDYWYNNQSEFANVSGWRFCVGPRYKNMLYQGVSFQAFNAANATQTDQNIAGTPGFGPGNTVITGLYMPCYYFGSGANLETIPLAEWTAVTYTSGGLQNCNGTVPYITVSEDERYGIFCPDVLFGDDKIDDKQVVFVCEIGVDAAPTKTVDAVCDPHHIHIDHSYLITTEGVAPLYYECEAQIVDDTYDNGNQWTTKFEDGTAGGSNYAFFDTLGVFDVANREVRVPRYLGLKITDSGYPKANQLRNKLVNVYKEDPDPAGNFFNNVVKIHQNTSAISYHRISQTLIPMGTIPASTIDIYGGDIFNGAFYFRPMQTGLDKGITQYAWTGAVDADQYGYGWLMRIYVESIYNIKMRGDDIVTEDTFYPYTAGISLTKANWAFTNAYLTQWKTEAFVYNAGYSITSPVNSRLGASIDYFPYDAKYNTIKFSEEHIDGVSVDKYRQLFDENQEFFQLGKGEIVAVVEMDGYLFTIQEKAINQHMVDQLHLGSSAAAGELVTAAGDVLPSSFRQLASFGSSHTASVFKSRNAIYGVDLYNRSVWRIIGSGGGYQAENLLVSKGYINWWESWIPDEAESINIWDVDDNPLQDRGVVGGFSFSEDIALFTFHLNGTFTNMAFTATISSGAWTGGTHWELLIPFTYDCSWMILDDSSLGDTMSIVSTNFTYNAYVLETTVAGGVTYVTLYCDTGIGVGDTPTAAADLAITITPSFMRKTLVFNEKIDSFIGEHDYFPRIYMPADKLLYSAGIHVYNTSYRIVKHYSNDGVNNTFNDTIVGADNNGLKYWELIFVVNGLKQEESAVLFSKIFKSLTLESSSTAFSSINYATEYQEGDQDPFLATEIWLTPEFLEHKWRVPIAVQTTPSTEFPGSGIDGTTFFADADIRGTWMKVTLRYYGTDDIFIKNAITKFLISNS